LVKELLTISRVGQKVKVKVLDCFKPPLSHRRLEDGAEDLYAQIIHRNSMQLSFEVKCNLTAIKGHFIPEGIDPAS
jgi:hypothetical protein